MKMTDDKAGLTAASIGFAPPPSDDSHPEPPPLFTSERKMELYSTWETLRFGLRSLRYPWRVMRAREACDIWCDGRR